MILLASCQKNSCDCEQNLNRLLRQDAATYSKDDINDFLCCVNDELTDNIELSQIRNEITFELLAKNTELFIYSLSENPDIYDQKTLLYIIEEPLNDKYSSEYLINKILSTTVETPIKEKLITILKASQ